MTTIPIISNVIAPPKKFPTKNLSNQICLTPYTSINVDVQGRVHLCLCQAWHPTAVGSLFHNSIDEILHNDLSIAIRQSISSGTYEYCDDTKCGVIYHNHLVPVHKLSADHQLLAADSTKSIMPNVIMMAGDLTCNLSCPSCRTEIFKPREDFIVQQKNLGLILQKNLFGRPSDQHIELNMSTSGELFASTMLLEFLQAIPVIDFPNLYLFIQTNGLLAKKKWASLGHFANRVRQITITTDAARPATYEKLRRGGKWSEIQSALQWIAQKKQQTGMKMILRMVVQTENYTEIEEFYDQARDLGADLVEYTRLLDWKTYTMQEFSRHDVLAERHPEFDRAQACIDKVKGRADVFLCGGIK